MLKGRHLLRAVVRRSFASKIEPSAAQPIYLDVQATSPMVIRCSDNKNHNGIQDPRVVDAMLPYMINDFGNAHSRTHSYGWKAEEGVEQARQHIANLIKV